MSDKIKAKETQLQVIVTDSGLEETKAKTLLSEFGGYFEMADEWAKKASEITVTDETQIMEMAAAREGRLFLREKRIAVENTRKKLKEQSLREGKAIDGIANILKALIVPIEERLKAQEDFVARKRKEAEQARREEAERALREKEEAEAEQARLEEEDRRRAIREENQRLKEEAETRAAELEVEKIKRAAAEAAAEVERQKREAETKKIQARERKKREKAQREADERMRKEEEQHQIDLAAARAEAELLAAMVECPTCRTRFDSRENSVDG